MPKSVIKIQKNEDGDSLIFYLLIKHTKEVDKVEEKNYRLFLFSVTKIGRKSHKTSKSDKRLKITRTLHFCSHESANLDSLTNAQIQHDFYMYHSVSKTVQIATILLCTNLHYHQV